MYFVKYKWEEGRGGDIKMKIQQDIQRVPNRDTKSVEEVYVKN